jgi:hypothetical protein
LSNIESHILRSAFLGCVTPKGYYRHIQHMFYSSDNSTEVAARSRVQQYKFDSIFYIDRDDMYQCGPRAQIDSGQCSMERVFDLRTCRSMCWCNAGDGHNQMSMTVLGLNSWAKSPNRVRASRFLSMVVRRCIRRAPTIIEPCLVGTSKGRARDEIGILLYRI